MKIAIVIPIYAKNQIHFDFLTRTLESILSEEHQLIFIPVENHIDKTFKNQNYPGLRYEIEKHPILGRQPQSVAKGWNTGIREAQKIGCNYILVLNQDIILRQDAIDKLVAFALTTPPDVVMWTMGQYGSIITLNSCNPGNEFSEHPNFSAFLVKSNFLDEMGNFDENFIPAYMEDNDMHIRIALSNKKALVYGGALFFHFGSRTVGSDPILSSEVATMFKINGDYFRAKWGAGTISEVDEMRKVYFKTPFNENNRALSYWR